MTKTQEQTKSKIIKHTLTNGMEIELDTAKLTGSLLYKCREISGGAATVLYMLAEVATFDGKKIPAPELIEWDAFDVVELEEFYMSLREKK